MALRTSGKQLERREMKVSEMKLDLKNFLTCWVVSLVDAGPGNFSHAV